MRDQQVLLKDYHVAPEVLWAAVKRALATVDGVTYERADEVEKLAYFRTGVTWTSWGQNMVARVEALEDEGARLDITGKFVTPFWPRTGVRSCTKLDSSVI